MFCSNCGTKLIDEAVFCSNCGTKVGFAASTNTPQAASSFDKKAALNVGIKAAGVLASFLAEEDGDDETLEDDEDIEEDIDEEV